MELVQRRVCCINRTDDIEPLIKLPQFPIYCNCTDTDMEGDMAADMEWGISKSSGMIQLTGVIPLHILYKNSHGSGSVGALWIRHHKKFAEFIMKYSPESVLEIGGGHGLLAKYANVKGTWTILEPNPTPVEGTPAKYIEGFFDDDFQYNGEFDAFVHSHTFEHMYDPEKFVQSLYNFIPEGKYLFFSLPDLERWIVNKYSNNIGWEHTLMLTEPYIDYLITKNDFQILDKYYFEEHSIFYAAIRSNNVQPKKLPSDLYVHNKMNFLNYFEYYHQIVADINYKIDKAERVFLFGGHVFSQLLIAMGLHTEKIVCLLDNDKNKQGKRLYGTKLSVSSPVILREEKNACVILIAGAYTEEIKKQILEEINSGVKFIP